MTATHSCTPKHNAMSCGWGDFLYTVYRNPDGTWGLATESKKLGKDSLVQHDLTAKEMSDLADLIYETLEFIKSGFNLTLQENLEKEQAED